MTNATYEAVRDHLSRMRIEDFGKYIKDWQETHQEEGVPECVTRALEDVLEGHIQHCARLLDLTKGIDPRKPGRHTTALGTPNHSSYTYKVRKALGYSYP